MFPRDEAPCSACVHARDCLLARPEVAAVAGPLVERSVLPGEYVQRQVLPVRQLLAPKVGLLMLRRRGPLAADHAVAVVGAALADGGSSGRSCGRCAASANTRSPLRRATSTRGHRSIAWMTSGCSRARSTRQG